MRGPGDKCAQMCSRIQKAGVRRVLQEAKSRARSDPARDLAIIRRAAVSGYVGAAETFGVNHTTARRIVMRYDEFARELLAADAAKGGDA